MATHLGPWLVETRFLRGAVLLGSGLGTADRRQLRFWFRCSSWHWAPRGQAPLREKSGHSRVCFFLHCRNDSRTGSQRHPGSHQPSKSPLGRSSQATLEAAY